ncbi:MAG: sulfatase [bacterium]
MKTMKPSYKRMGGRAVVALLLFLVCGCQDRQATPLQKLVSFPVVEESSEREVFAGRGKSARMVFINGVHRESMVLEPGGELEADYTGSGGFYFQVGAPSGSRLGSGIESSVVVTVSGARGKSRKKSVSPAPGEWVPVRIDVGDDLKSGAIKLELRAEGSPAELAGEAVAIGPAFLNRDFQKPNIIIISIDTLRADHLEPYGHDMPVSPAISALAHESILFERCYSHASWTPPSVASLFTSLYPVQHGSLGKDRIPLSSGNRTMAETFAEAGYFTAAFSSSPFVHPDFGFGQGFRVFGFEEDENAAALTAMAVDWLHERPAGPFFLYVMYFDPHFPYVPPENYLGMFRKGPEGKPLWRAGHVPNIKSLYGLSAEVGRETYNFLHSSYQGEIAFTDDRVGALISRFRQEGLLRNSIVVLTSDHGEEFLEHGGFGHGNTLYEEQLHVPLLVRLPGGSGGGRRIASITRQVDLLPTLLEFAGIEHPAPVEGKSFLSALTQDEDLPDRPAFATSMHLLHEGQTMKSLRQGRHKLILYENPDRALLFDLDEDPSELHNLVREKPELRKRMMESLIRLEENLAKPELGQAGKPAPGRTRKLLDSLGYVGD